MDEEIFIDCNQKTLDLFGCKKEEIVGKPPYVFSPRNATGQQNFQRESS